ncbi:MAG: extracellular solute-binding protein [Chloroflexi bacterium]|nr:extracellular solute-binding protein [Chloroflexota bacterium]
MIMLRGMTWDHPRGFQPLQVSTPVYAKETGVQIEWGKRSLKEFADTPIDILAAEYDLMVIDHPHMGSSVATGSLLALDGYLPTATLKTLNAQSAGPSHQSYFYQDHQWALANDAAMQVACYRPDLVEVALPTSWDEALTYGEQVKDSSHMMAVPLCPTDSICTFLTLSASVGYPIGGSDHLIEDDAGQAVLALMLKLAEISHPESRNWNPIQMLNHMSSTDEIAYCPVTFSYTNYSRDGYAEHLIHFTDLPGKKGALLGGAGIAVSSNTKHPEEAAAYAAWISSAEVQKGLYVENGGQPGNREAWLDDHSNTLTHNFFRNTLATLDASYLRPRYNGWMHFQEEGGNIIHAMLMGWSDAPTCLQQLRTLYQSTL